MGAYTYFSEMEIEDRKTTHSQELNALIRELDDLGFNYFAQASIYYHRKKFWQKKKGEYRYILFHCPSPLASINEVRQVNLKGFLQGVTTHEVILYLMGVVTGILSEKKKLS